MATPLLIDNEAHHAAVVVGIQVGHDLAAVQEDLDELTGLLAALGVETKGQVIQRRPKLSASHLLGSGKIDEIRDYAAAEGAKLIVIDHTLSGPQIRNLEEKTGCLVLDRSGVILDIFARHARTSQAKTQVEIAQLEYLLPRMSGAWTHFQRQTGGRVRARGMGEKQIEVDRRRARERIARLQRKLESIRRERQLQRKARQNELKVALVGYTNSGKTSLMHALTQAETEGKDELFATLDASVRTIDPTTRPRILLSDTVGFIRNLPHSLVASFRSTLDEVASADLLLHVVDLSHANYSGQVEVTEDVLSEIGAGKIPAIKVFNKADLIEEQFLGRIVQKKYPGSIVVSAISRDDMVQLRQHIYAFFGQQFHRGVLEVPAEEHDALSLIHSHCVIQEADYHQPGVVIFRVRAPARILARLRRWNVDPENPEPEGGDELTES